MKQFLFLLCFLPLVASAATQNSSLDSPGDVAILAYNGYDVSPSVIYNDGLTFLLVDDCPNGTTLTITDEEWDGTAFSTPTGEGNLTWTNNTGSTLARGTVIKITNASDDPSTSGITVNIGSAAESDTGFNMIDGDQLYIYTGTRAAPGVFLAFYGDESSLGNGDAATISGTSLVNGQTAQLNILQGYYIGPASCNSTLSDCLSQIYNTSNWSFTDNPSYPSNLPDTFTGSLFSTNNAPTAASFTASPVYQGTAYAFSTSDFSYSDTDGDPLNHIRIVTVPAQGSLWLDSDGSNTINGGESALSNGSLVSKASIDAGYLKYLNTTGSSSSFTFDVNDGTAYSAGSYTTTLTVTAYPSITLSASSTSPAESAGSVNLTATASHAFNQDITVNLSYSGTATSGVDYTQISSLVITTGNTTKTSALSISEDATEEVNETIIVDISTVSNGTESGTQQQTITIVDNDQTIPSVAISGASGTINAAFTATFTFSEDVTGFTVGDIVAGNASVSAFSATNASVYTALITPTTDGAVTVDVAGSVAQDGVGNNNTAATQLAVTYDGTAPTVAISGASGSINAPFTATFTFSENVTGFTVGDIVAGNASVSAFSATSASVYTALITPTTDGSVTVDVAGSVAQDGVGNNNTAATQLAVTYDGTAPTVAISGASGNINAAFTATFTFSENVTGFTVGDIVAGNASVSAFSATSASVYTALITPTTDGAVTVDVAGAAAQDAAGNNNTAATQLAVTYDATAPTMAISGVSGSINAPFTATFTFSENVTGFTVGDIVAGNASVSAFSATSASVYTALITPTTDGAVTVDVAGSVAQDGAGNNNTAATQLAVTYDATAPTVAISGASGNINAAFTATFTFSENVTGFTVGDIVAGNASVSAFSATSASVYTALITPTTDGSVTVDVAGSVAQDGVGNSNTAATQLAVTYDGTAPTVAISGASGSINAAFTATFTFSENVTGFTVGDIVAGNASVSAFSATSASVYTALITPTTDGSVTVDVAGSVAQDGVGNNNTAATQLAVTYDGTAPTVAISGASGNINAAFTATFTFSENVTGFTVGDIVAGNASVSAFSATSASVYTALITPTTDGAVTVDVAGAAAQDAAGNNNTAATQLAVTYDATAPTMAISGVSGSINAPFTATFTFSENVTGFTVGDIVAGNASVSAFSATSASVYTALITPTADGSVTVNVAAATAQDAAGNNNTAATQLAVTYDATAPTVAISGASGVVNGPFTATFTFSEVVGDFVAADVTLTNATPGAFVTVSQTEYRLEVTPAALGQVTVTVAANSAHDAATNGNPQSTLSVNYQDSVPTLSLQGPALATGSFTLTLEFSETVTGLEETDITVANGSVQQLTGSGALYSAEILPATLGSVVSISVAAGAVKDLSGQDNQAAMLMVFTNNNGSVGISGLAVEGQVLSAQVNDADGIDDATQVYQWLSDGNPVGSAATYTIVAGDVGHSISLQVSYTDDLGRDEQWTSAATGTVISIQQYALDTISAAAGSDVNAALLTVVQYRQAGLDWPDNVGFTRILPILNSAVARSQSDDVNELSELEALVALIMEAQDDDGDGLPNSLEGTATTDRDGDGIVDRKDTDSDQDGLSDRVEQGLVLTDTDSDGIIDFFDADIDNDGNVDDGRTDDNLDGAEDSLMTVEGYRAANALADADSDGLLNSQDLDSDNDSIGDIVENRLADADGNLLVDDARVEIDDSNDLIDDNNDGIFNFLQLSSDGIQTDFSRTGLPKLLDADNDGRLDSTVDMDRDGLIDAVDNAVGAFGSLPDIDGDGIPNHLDDDDDGDGIPDADENPQLGFFTGLDADADGIDDGVDYDVNGLISGTDTNANGVRDDREMPDHDNDGIADHLDPDSDNDNVTDGEDPSINTGDDVTTATGAFSPLMLLIAAALAMAGRMAARMSVPTLLLVGMLWAPLSQANSTQPASELAVDDMHWLLAWGVGYSWLSPEVHGNNKVTDDGGLAGHFAAGLQLDDAWQIRYQYNIPGSAEVNSAAIEYTVHSLLAQYSQPLQGQWRWMLGAGASQIDVDVAAGFNADLDSEIQLSLQAGASYQLPNNISIALQATRYSGDVQTLMLDFSHLIP